MHFSPEWTIKSSRKVEHMKRHEKKMFELTLKLFGNQNDFFKEVTIKEKLTKKMSVKIG